MHRLLVADGGDGFSDAIVKALKDEYLVEVCHNGMYAVELLRSFEPDILVLDTMLPGLDGLSILRAVAGSGCSTKVIALCRCYEDYVLSSLQNLGVSYVFPKPCTANAVIASVREISFRLRYPDSADWCVENESELLLLSLGFRMGPVRFRITEEAVLYRYKHPDSVITKEVYPAVARRFSGTSQQVEKAIRDAIKDAWNCGDKAVWALYFPYSKGETPRYPTNDDFIARVAASLTQRQRLKKTYLRNVQ